MAENSESGNTKKAVSFLNHFRQTGLHNIVAIDPVSEAVTGITRPNGHPDIVAFIDRYNGVRNLYYSVNEPKPDAPDDKLKKHDIGKIHGVWLDADPKKDLPFEREKERLGKFATELKISKNPPTYITDSGGGIQAFWLYDKPVDATKDAVIKAESLSRGLAEQYGTDFVQNIDRVMRIPFTVNIPNKKKAEAGRTKTVARIIHADSPSGKRYADLPFITPSFKAEAEEKFLHTDLDMEAIKKPLSKELQERLNDTFMRDKKAHDLWTGKIEKPSRSEYDFTLTQQLVWDNYSLQEVGQILWHYEKGKGHDLDKREIVRTYNRVDRPFNDLDPAYVAAIEKQVNPILKARAAGMRLSEDLKKVKKARRGIIHASKASHKTSGIPLIKGFIDQQSMVILYGAPNSGKSFVTLDIGMAIASGQTHWGSFKIKQKMGVLVVCGEAGQSYGKRVEATRRRFGFNDNTTYAELPFAYLDNYYDLMNDADHLNEIRNSVIELEKKSGHKCGLVVIDTLSATFGSGNENASEDARKYLQNLKQIAHDLNVTILIVHHTGKNEESGARGSSVFLGDVDTQLKVHAVKKGERYERTVISTKQRDTAKDQVTRFGLIVVELGKDEDGDVIDTCHVVLENDVEFESVVPNPADGMEPGEIAIMKADEIYNKIQNIGNLKTSWKLTERYLKALIHRDIKDKIGVLVKADGRLDPHALSAMAKPSDTVMKAYGRDREKFDARGMSVIEDGSNTVNDDFQ